MKVFLMYPDRDFEPVQKSSPEQRLVPRQKLPGSEPRLIQDLELNTLLNAMALNDEFLFNVAKQAILSSLDSPRNNSLPPGYPQGLLETPRSHSRDLSHPNTIRRKQAQALDGHLQH